MRAPRLPYVVAAVVSSSLFGCSEKFSTEPTRVGSSGGDAASGTGGQAGSTSTGGRSGNANDASTGGGSGSGNDAGAGGAREAGGVTPEGSVGSGEAGVVPPESGLSKPVEIEVAIGHDTDDATWIGGDDERLRYGTDSAFDEVGADFEMGRAAFRFELPIPPSSIIESAVLRLQHERGDADETETMLVQVFDSASIPPFDDDHAHPPAGHVPEGLWPILVPGFAVGLAGSQIESPDLTPLVQHVVNRPDWTATTGSIGFVLSPDTLTTWVGLADSASGQTGTRLRIVYRPPTR